MFRFVSLALMALVIALATTYDVRAQPRTAPAAKTLKLGETLEAELTVASKQTQYYFMTERGKVATVSPPFVVYSAQFSVNLQAGQGVNLTTVVTGKGRKVSVALLDPTGMGIAAPKSLEEKTSKVSFEEVSVKGTYKVIVTSDAIGPFTLRVTTDAEMEDKGALEARLKELKKEAEQIEAKLKELNEKSKK